MIIQYNNILFNTIIYYLIIHYIIEFLNCNTFPKAQLIQPKSVAFLTFDSTMHKSSQRQSIDEGGIICR